MTATVGCALLAVSVGACGDLNSAYRRLGVQLQADDSLIVRFLACDDERIERVTLWQLDSDQIAGDAGDTRLWTFQPGATDRTVQFTPASADGIPITLDPAKRYYVETYTSRGAADSDAIRLADLRVDQVRVSSALKTLADFTSDAKRSCSSR